MAKPKVANLFSALEGQSEDLGLQSRKTDELIIGFVGPVGSGVSLTAGLFAKLLHEDYKYTPSTISVSRDIIEPNAHLIDEKIDNYESGSVRVTQLQRIGTKLRKKFALEYIAEKCVEKISMIRSKENPSGAENFAPSPRRHVHIIDSLKNPSEYDLLRDVYGDCFWLIGVFAPPEVRKERLTSKGFDDEAIQTIFNTDEEEGVEHGQKVRDTIERSDFFIRNDSYNDERLTSVVQRYLKIIFGEGVITPTQDEAAMYTAVSSAASSACLSRQVGAAIYSAKGELLGKGSNDVPRSGGGLYRWEDATDDHRCYKYGGHTCHNDERKARLYQEIINSLISDGHMGRPKSMGDVISSLKKTDVKQLIEYSRAVHAEMDAIISVARSGKPGLPGSTLYCTTFPCHSCARHIVAAGISKVVYIEPYPKSLATVLHRDAISVKEQDSERRVVFLQYEGVAPKNMIRLFKSAKPRKKDGRLVPFDRATASPISRSPLDGFATREQIVVYRLMQVESRVKQEDGEGNDAEA